MRPPQDDICESCHALRRTWLPKHKRLAQAAVVEAIFVYNTAQRDQMLPRKALPHPELNEQRKAPLKNVMPGAEEKAPEEKK